MNSGVIPSPPDERDYPVSAILPRVTLPEAVRLDKKILSIRNQGFFPTCVGKSGAGIMSAGFKHELSSIFVYSKCKEMDGIPHLPGTYPRVAMKVMQKYGACLDKILPYSMMANPMPRVTDLHYLEAEQRKITAYARARGLEDIKQTLINGHLLMGCMLVADNFMNYRGEGIVGIPTGQTHGYHAVIICGYDDGKKALRIANSWGSWGDKGFAWLSYDYLMNQSHFPEAWVVEIRQSAEDIYPDRIFRLVKKN